MRWRACLLRKRPHIRLSFGEADELLCSAKIEFALLEGLCRHRRIKYLFGCRGHLHHELVVYP